MSRNAQRRERPVCTPDGMFTTAQAEEMLGLRGGGLHRWLRAHPMQRRSCPRIGKYRFVPVQVLERYEAATNGNIPRAARRPAGYVGIDAATELTGSSASVVWTAARRGDIRAVRIGTIHYYNPDDCRRLAQQRADTPLPGYAQVLTYATAHRADTTSCLRWLRAHGHTPRKFRRPADMQVAWYAQQAALDEWAATRPLTNRKLTQEDARTIRARRAAGEKRTALAAEYGVSEACIYQIILRRTYREEQHAAD